MTAASVRKRLEFARRTVQWPVSGIATIIGLFLSWLAGQLLFCEPVLLGATPALIVLSVIVLVPCFLWNLAIFAACLMGPMWVSVLVGKKLRACIERTAQWTRDREARALKEFGTFPTQFYLYLRPFWSDVPGGAGIDVELESALAPVRLIAIGSQPGAIGVGKIRTGEEWWHIFRRLTPRAGAVFVLPLLGRELMREIAFLSELRLLSKCAFVMPPAWASGSHSAESAAWDQARKELRELRIYLPPFVRQGLIFSLDENGMFAVGAPWRSSALPWCDELKQSLERPASVARRRKRTPKTGRANGFRKLQEPTGADQDVPALDECVVGENEFAVLRERIRDDLANRSLREKLEVVLPSTAFGWPRW